MSITQSLGEKIVLQMAPLKEKLQHRSPRPGPVCSVMVLAYYLASQDIPNKDVPVKLQFITMASGPQLISEAN